MARHTSSTGVAEDVGQLDESTGRGRCRFVVERPWLDWFLSSRAQPRAATERCEHRVGDDRRCRRPSSLLGVERREGHPERTDCFANGVVVLAQSPVALRGGQHAGQEALDDDTASQLVVGRQREERTEEPFTVPAPSCMGAIDDLIEVIEIRNLIGQVTGDSVGPRSSLAKCPGGMAKAGPLTIELRRQAVIVRRPDGSGGAGLGVATSGGVVW